MSLMFEFRGHDLNFDFQHLRHFGWGSVSTLISQSPWLEVINYINGIDKLSKWISIWWKSGQRI